MVQLSGGGEAGNIYPDKPNFGFDLERFIQDVLRPPQFAQQAAIDFLNFSSDIGISTYQNSLKLAEGAEAILPYVSPPLAGLLDKTGITGDNGGDGTNTYTPGLTHKFLPYLFGGMLAVAAAPTLYKAIRGPRRGKRASKGDEMALSLENASTRATTLLTAFAPVVAFPATYIAIDELENRGIISNGLGNATQGLMTAMASGQLISGLTSLAGSLVKAVV